jgi:hypothetical protein
MSESVAEPKFIATLPLFVPHLDCIRRCIPEVEGIGFEVEDR